MSEIALIGKKIGMSREFYKTGQSVPVTVIKMEKGRVIQVIEEEKRSNKTEQIGFGKIKKCPTQSIFQPNNCFADQNRPGLKKRKILFPGTLDP